MLTLGLDTFRFLPFGGKDYWRDDSVAVAFGTEFIVFDCINVESANGAWFSQTVLFCLGTRIYSCCQELLGASNQDISMIKYVLLLQPP